MSELTDTEKELLLEVKCLVLDLNATLEVLDLNLYNGTGLAPSGKQALALIRRLDPGWEAFSFLDREEADENDEDSNYDHVQVA